MNRSVSLDQIRRHFAWTLGQKPHGLGAIALHADNQLLDVQNNVGDILIHAWKTCERVRYTGDLHAGDGRAFKAGQENATKTVSDGGSKAALKWLSGETTKGGCQTLLFYSDM